MEEQSKPTQDREHEIYIQIAQTYYKWKSDICRDDSETMEFIYKGKIERLTFAEYKRLFDEGFVLFDSTKTNLHLTLKGVSIFI